MADCLIDVEVGRKEIRLRTASGAHRFEVWEGGVDRELYDLLKSLEQPLLRTYVRTPWVVRVPRPFAGCLPNEGSERRFITFTAPDRGRFVLRCADHAPLPINHELHMLFLSLNRAEDKEIPYGHEENRRRSAAEVEGRLEQGRGSEHGPGAPAGLDGSAGQGQAVTPPSALKRTKSQEKYLEKIRKRKATKKGHRTSIGVPSHAGKGKYARKIPAL